MKLLSEKLYGDFSKSYFFIALSGKKVVGRIAAIINYAYNEKTGEKTIRFSRFDCIEDFDVAKALFDKCVEIAKHSGLDTVIGPLGYTDFDREGLLYYGFDKIATYGTNYNYEYYVKLVEQYGFEKAFDWYERRVDINDESFDSSFLKIAPLIAKRYNLKEYATSEKTVAEVIKNKGLEFFDLINVAYKDLHGIVPITKKVALATLKDLKLMFNINYASFIVNEKNELVGAAVGMRSIAKALNKCGGKLFPTGIFRLLAAMSAKNKEIEFLLIAVRPDYQNKGITSIMMSKMYNSLMADKIIGVETNCTLEDNYVINNQWDNFPNIMHKKRRCYKLKIEN